MLLPASSSLARAGAPRVWAQRPSRYSAGAEQWRGGRNAAPRRAEPGSSRGPTCVSATAVALLGWCQGAEGRAQRRSTPGRARLGPGPHVCGRHGRHATRLAPRSGREGAIPLPDGPRQARIGAPRVWAPRLSCYSAGAEQLRGGRNAALRRAEHGSDRGSTSVGATAGAPRVWAPQQRRQLHAGAPRVWAPQQRLSTPGLHECGRRSTAGAPRVWAPQPSRYSIGAELLMGGRNAAARRPPGRAWPGGSGRGPTCAGASAVKLLGWCLAAEGRAQRRSPPGQAWLGPGPHVCGCHGRHATRLVPSRGGESATPAHAGPSMARAGAPRVWSPRQSRY